MAPVYEELATVYHKNKDRLVIAQVNADEAKNRPLAQRFGVQGFPTLKWFPKGTTDPVDYNGGRSVEDFVAYIAKETGLRGSLPPSHTFVLDDYNFEKVI